MKIDYKITIGLIMLLPCFSFSKAPTDVRELFPRFFVESCREARLENCKFLISTQSTLADLTPLVKRRSDREIDPSQYAALMFFTHYLSERFVDSSSGNGCEEVNIALKDLGISCSPGAKFYGISDPLFEQLANKASDNKFGPMTVAMGYQQRLFMSFPEDEIPPRIEDIEFVDHLLAQGVDPRLSPYLLRISASGWTAYALSKENDNSRHEFEMKARQAYKTLLSLDENLEPDFISLNLKKAATKLATLSQPGATPDADSGRR